MTHLKQYLHTRLIDLETNERRLLSKPYLKSQLLLIQNEIKETKAALEGIRHWEAKKELV